MVKAQRGGRALRIFGFSLLGLLVIGGIVVGILFATGVIKTGKGGSGGSGSSGSTSGTSASIDTHRTMCIPPVITNASFSSVSKMIKVDISNISRDCLISGGIGWTARFTDANDAELSATSGFIDISPSETSFYIPAVVSEGLQTTGEFHAYIRITYQGGSDIGHAYHLTYRYP